MMSVMQKGTYLMFDFFFFAKKHVGRGATASVLFGVCGILNSCITNICRG